MDFGQTFYGVSVNATETGRGECEMKLLLLVLLEEVKALEVE